MSIHRTPPFKPGKAPSKWCVTKDNAEQHGWCANRDSSETHCTCSCHRPDDTLKTYGGYYGDLKVYRWVEHDGYDLQKQFPEWAKTNRHSIQSENIIAAKSKAEAARLAGYKRPSQMWNLGETGNVISCGVALNQPGVVFWQPLSNAHGLPFLPKPKR